MLLLIFGRDQLPNAWATFAGVALQLVDGINIAEYDSQYLVFTSLNEIESLESKQKRT